MIAVLLLAAAGFLDTKQAYDNCARTEAVRLGSTNSETADTILRAVRSKCAPQWVALETVYPAVGLPDIDAERARSLVLWRSQAEDAAVAALLESRRKSP